LVYFRHTYGKDTILADKLNYADVSFRLLSEHYATASFGLALRYLHNTSSCSYFHFCL